MKLLWATDLHLIDTAATDWSPLLCAVDDETHAIILTGDIAESDQLLATLDSLADEAKVPVFFVLGNHDFYGSNIGETTRRVVHHVRGDDRLVYLTDSQPIELATNTYLIGDDGWGDAVEGNYETSFVRLNDFKRIDDFRDLASDHWKQKLIELGQQCADRLSSKLDQIPGDAAHVLIATHVPPFCEACWYEGKTTDENWSPFFVCGAVGRVLREFAASHPSINVTVICGHTHHDGIAKIANNLIVHTGAATGGVPEIEAELTIDEVGLSVKRLS
ncbi:Calcineurin-like phosphoesterase superfamily domain protein [Rubripirellula obstinata]|uniref:Calcineurin-like phosphoesterase superfamily domain protein n=1 Tax=Rubripirellula obstinata TaxID=406547 RepID=A0A5B1CQZ3_9BACT|nr:metallophosphoesterase [Rubripirellula obstinata]KAA1261664.1 Calcineurin-like phosphoesterase superfamily domain protein [Rubripirellula obstinata]